jgi:hypothetical protein
MFDEHYIEDLTGLKARTRLELAGYYAKLNESDKVEAHRRQVELFRIWRSQNKTERTKDAENNYAALLAALRTMRKIEMSPTVNNDEQLDVRIQRLKKNRTPKSTKLKNVIEKRYLTEILRLRGKKLSWRQISAYLKKYFQIQVSHSYISKIVEEHSDHGLDDVGLNSGIEMPEKMNEHP